ncbi:unnamed protein product [Chilo suppressalis]|uniref:MGA conserved domain-containing protein n=1 Tax=Chilo suppressalis TaxID=168631 RepID=A0ABN8APV6_CHISP|nr:unnamed protein product [Chilo suppressalis]
MEKVFSSDIIRSKTYQNNDLRDLYKVIPAQPTSNRNKIDNECGFQPKNDKYYVPKKKSKLKVRTVRDLRNTYEKDVLIDLPYHLERQQNALLRKIRDGSSTKNQTKLLAKNVLNNEDPITRSSWQMLMNINPEDHLHSFQYVLFDGEPIRINGSKGGGKKFIYNFDLGNLRKKIKKYSQNKTKSSLKKKYLLRNSLSVNFKPGPLTRKKQLDKSYQKYNVGKIELINLPKPILEIQSAHGNTLDSTITNLINNFRDVNGFISEKWAEFAVSVLGAKNASVVYQSNSSPVTFDLGYKCDQRRILMRRDQDRECRKPKIIPTMKPTDIFTADECDVIPEIRDMISEMLDAVEISLNQANMYTGEDEPREQCGKDLLKGTSYLKDRNKKKYCELDRLDVTVIRLPENDINTNLSVCRKSFCRLGCICNSLQCTIPLKSHCGRIGCMFACKCDLSKYKLSADYDGECRDLLPGLINLKEEMNNKLSKEEQKFHQTVIVTGNQSILLKSKRRNLKSSKKYEDFYCDTNSKPELKLNPVLSIFITKLNCDNIEPWCMVHNLYKCFCKCKFTDTVSTEKVLIEPEKSEVVLDEDLSYFETSLSNDKEEQFKNRLRDDKTTETNNTVIILDDESTYSSKRNETVRYRTRYGREICVSQDDHNNIDSFECARIKPFIERKYSLGYYINTNQKIKNMEVNDSYLRNRLQYLVDKSVQLDTIINNTTPEKGDTRRRQRKERHKERSTDENVEINSNPIAISENSSDSDCLKTDINPPNLEMIEASSDKRISNKPKLVAWLESSYQQYKKRMEMGIIKCTLEPPKKGKVCLYPWNFILSRYSERKNLFLVSKNEPFRIFMAVDNKNPLFEQCINIDEIRFADLNKYPVTVKNLLTNTSGLKENFCILFGLSHCWELIGAVMKINDSKDKSDKDNSLTDNLSDQELTCLSSSNKEMIEKPALEQTVSDTSNSSISAKDSLELSSPSKCSTSESSKWFVMTIENDFSEIQFYNKGFFVKHESIVKAINVARVTGKTVRLSSQKCSDKSNNPQFGIYAIPNANDYCVFVGPYEIDESLGIETVKIVSKARKNRTRGVWINTNKVDNLKVIDNPLSFMPSQDIQMNGMLPLENMSTEYNDIPSSTQPQPDKSLKKNISKDDQKNTVKPIKLKKSTGLYRIAPQSLLKKINKISQVESMPTEGAIISKPSPSIMSSPLIPLLTKPLQYPIIISSLPKPTCPPSTDDRLVMVLDSKIQNIPVVCERKKPVAEVAPQIKIAAVYSEAKDVQTEIKRPERMVILKPEEINKRVILDNNIPKLEPSPPVQVNTETMDIEDFLDSSTVCAAPADNPLIISDDEDESSPRKVWIKCKNVKLGFIEAEMNKEGEISFKFPGFKCSNFYKKNVAFAKIHQVLTRKVYVTTGLNLEWEVIDANDKIENFQLLKEEDLHANNVLSKNGLHHNSLLFKSNISYIKTYSRRKLQDSPSASTENPEQLSSDFIENVGSAIVKSMVDATLEDRQKLTNKLQDITNENEELSLSPQCEEKSEERDQSNANDV